MANLLPLQPIFNAGQVTLDQNPGTLPNMLDALLQWFQPITFGQTVKSIVNFNVVEVATAINCFGLWQPMTAQKLWMRPEGQRKWKWFTLHALPSPALSPDDIIIKQGVQYRVMEKLDYTQMGYIEYNLVQDYTGSGPTQE